MKLKLEDKLKIITMYEVGDSIPSISKKFKVCESENLKFVNQLLNG